MYERLLDKKQPPSPDFIKDYIGIESYKIMLQFEDFLNSKVRNIKIKYDMPMSYLT